MSVHRGQYLFRLCVVIVMLLIASSQVRAQDTAHVAQSESRWYTNAAGQLVFASIGFCIGFIPGGYKQVGDEYNGRVPQGSLWPFTAPLMTSCGIDCIATNFWKNKHTKGSYWGGVGGAFLGEMIGALAQIGIQWRRAKPFAIFAGYWIPSTLFSVLFYNLFTGGSAKPTHSDILLAPNIGPNYAGASFQMRF